MRAAHKFRAPSHPGSAEPLSSHILSGSFFSSASTPLTITSSSHQTEDDRTARRVKTFGNHRPSVIVSSAPSDEPPKPVNSASGLVRYFESMNGFSSWMKFRILPGQTTTALFPLSFGVDDATCRGVFVNPIRARIGNRHDDERFNQSPPN